MFKKVPIKFSNFSSCDGACFTQVESKMSVDGRIISSFESRNVRELVLSSPPSDEFSLNAQLKAGVPLKEVNSKLLSSSISESFIDSLVTESPNVESENVES